MKLPRILSLASFLFLAFVPACSNTKPMSESTPVPILHPTETVNVIPTTLFTPPTMESKTVNNIDPILIEKAKNDLANQLDIAVNQIHVVEASEVTWPDTSLGCPQDGIMYAQVETDGYLILLNINAQIYEYHTDTTQEIVFCKENPARSLPKSGNIKDDTPWIPVEPVEPGPKVP